MSCPRDRTSWWIKQAASGRKPFWFCHLLKYESKGFIAERVSIHLFRSCSMEGCCWPLSLALSYSVLSCISLSSIFKPSSAPSPHHLNVVMLSWQLKCFLSACWVNWLSQKCFLPFTLPPAYVHTHLHVFSKLVRCLIGALHYLAPNSSTYQHKKVPYCITPNLNQILTLPLKPSVNLQTPPWRHDGHPQSPRKDTRAPIHTHIPALGEILIKCFIQQCQLLSLKACLSPES